MIKLTQGLQQSSETSIEGHELPGIVSFVSVWVGTGVVEVKYTHSISCSPKPPLVL